jgi:hypothetical protein
MKQTAAHPLLGELRAARTQLQSLLKTLALPDEARSSGGAHKSPQHQRAAETRWARRDAEVAAQRERADLAGG